MRFVFSLAIVIIFTVSVYGETPDLSGLEQWVKQLGDERFTQRIEAEKKIMEFARAEPEKMNSLLEAQLKTTADPEIKHRLKGLIRTIARTIPARPVPFSEARLEDKTWTLTHKGEDATYAFKNGTLEMNSLNDPTVALLFTHKHNLGKVKQVRRFGAPIVIEPKRLVLDAEIKIDKEQHSRSGAAGFALLLEDHWTSYPMMIHENGIFPYPNHKDRHPMNTTDDWHHYRVVIDGRQQQFFVDDMKKPVIELRRSTSAGRNWAAFGDAGSAAGSRAQVRNVVFQALEPQSLDPKDLKP